MSWPHTLECGGLRFECASLLGRAPWSANLPDDWSRRLGRVLVTGGTGSLGSALVRVLVDEQVPVMIGDIDEDALHRVEHDGAQVRLLDVADEVGVAEVYADWRPTTVFHLAARKHVSVCQHSPRAAFSTNVVGTHVVRRCAAALDPAPVIVIASSDKAVAATNVLGRTKRWVEQLARAVGREHGPPTVSLRLCNVLGTRGNVLEVFADRCRRGQAIEVWSADMSRYFACRHEMLEALIALALWPSHAAVIVPEFCTALPIAALAQRFVDSARAQGVDARAVVTERFESFHARHEALYMTGEQPRSATPVPGLAALVDEPRVLARGRERFANLTVDELLASIARARPDDAALLRKMISPAHMTATELDTLVTLAWSSMS